MSDIGGLRYANDANFRAHTQVDPDHTMTMDVKVRVVAAATVASGVVVALIMRRWRANASAKSAAAATVAYYTSELIHSAPSPQRVLKRTWADVGYGGLWGWMDAMYLSGTWFYEKPLDARAIQETMKALVLRVPALAGRRCGWNGIALSNAGARFSVCEAHPGSAYDYVDRADGPPRHIEGPTLRGLLADAPLTAFGGDEPLFTVRVTNFADGTSAISIASAHSLGDGKSYFGLVQAFAAAHNHGTFDLRPLPSFDSASAWEAAMPTVDRTATTSAFWLPEWVRARRVEPRVTPIYERMSRTSLRAKIHVSASELAALKHDINASLREEAEEREGAAAASTGGVEAAAAAAVGVTSNEAISAAMFIALKDDWPAFRPGQPAHVTMFVNCQGKGCFRSMRKNVGGNFSVTAAPHRTSKPPAEYTMPEAARLFRSIGDEWRDAVQSARRVDSFVGVHRYMDLTGRMGTHGTYAYERFFKVPNEDFIVNNQMR